MYKKCISNSYIYVYIYIYIYIYIYTKNVQTLQNMYKVRTKSRLKFDVCFLFIQTMYKLCKTYTTS